MPKPMVTMASDGPFTRSEGSAINTPSAADTQAAASSASQGFQPACAVSSATVYAPAANRPAWPSDFWPLQPTSTFRPAAAM